MALQDLFDDAIKAGKGVVEKRGAAIQKMRTIGTVISLYATQNVHGKNWLLFEYLPPGRILPNGHEHTRWLQRQ
jgi:hypothetical protein